MADLDREEGTVYESDIVDSDELGGRRSGGAGDAALDTLTSAG